MEDYERRRGLGDNCKSDSHVILHITGDMAVVYDMVGVKMRLKDLDPGTSLKFWGLVAILIMLPQVVAVGTMFATYEQPLDDANYIAMTVHQEFPAGSRAYFIRSTAYWASAYGNSGNHGEYGNAYFKDVSRYEGMTLNLTIIPLVLGLDMVYLMQFSRTEYYNSGDETYRLYMEQKKGNVVLVADLRHNETYRNTYTNITCTVPEITDGQWYLVFFCTDMGYNGTPGNNPDGMVKFNVRVMAEA